MMYPERTAVFNALNWLDAVLFPSGRNHMELGSAAGDTGKKKHGLCCHLLLLGFIILMAVADVCP